MAHILNGKEVRDIIRNDLKEQVAHFATKPTLAIIQVGDRPDSNVYIRQKKLFAEAIGAKVIHNVFPETVTQEELVSTIELYNQDISVHGILLQLPFPQHLNKEDLLEKIVAVKDVDGLTAANIKALFDETGRGHIAATARGIISLLDFAKIDLKGKNVVMIGRSSLVGKPTALACMHRDATVTIAHKHTQELEKITQNADIIIVAIGDPEFITQKYVRQGQIVIDVGINEIERDGKQKLVGDVKFEEVEKMVDIITPVPGGVGPMTVASLFQNLIDAYTRLK
ncbi:MAG: bifunctional 5,10-methylenetetrahydrofolate dehydrogenase/5,10-methenyltetrahydrofolate cyclohydrolase [Patescibacteria group bacterium]